MRPWGSSLARRVPSKAASHDQILPIEEVSAAAPATVVDRLDMQPGLLQQIEQKLLFKRDRRLWRLLEADAIATTDVVFEAQGGIKTAGRAEQVRRLLVDEVERQ